MKQEIKERVEKIRRGEVPEGYRKTKVGIIPYDWANHKLSKLGFFKNGINKDKQDFGHGTPLINLNDVFGSKVLHGDDHFESLVNCSKNEINNYDLKDGDVLFVRSSVKPEGVGLTAIIDTDIENTVYSGFLIRYRVTQKLIKNFRKYAFDGFYFRKNMLKKSTISANTNVSQDILNSLEIIVPSEPEQEKIAETLSTWDKAIELKEKQISHSNEYKKGFMRKLLFKREASTPWTKIQLIKCLIPTSYPVNKPSEPYNALGIRSHCKGTLVRHIEDPTKIAMDTLYEVKENELILNITFAWEGAITLLSKKDEGKVVSHRFPTYKFNKEYAIPDYFKHLIKTKWFVFQLGSLSPGGAGRNRVLNKTDFLKLKVLLPSVEEQIKIADLLNSIDDTIELLKLELNHLKEQKRGLMQLLLTGIVRVEVN